MRSRLSPYLLLTLAALFWGGNFVLGRAIHNDIPPVALNFWRWVVAGAVLLPFAARRVARHWPAIRRHAGLMVALAATGVALFNTFVYVALNTTTAINASLMLACIPIMIPAMSFVLHRESLSPRQGVGIAASVVGVVIVITRGDPAVLANLGFTPGDLWMLLSIPTWSLYSVLLRRCPASMPPIDILAVTTAIGVVLLLPVYLWELAARGAFAVTLANGVSILYLALFAAIAAFLFWHTGVARVGANKAGLFVHLVPVFSAGLAIILLGEALRAHHVAGVAFILAGIYLTTTAPGAAEPE